MAKTKRLGVGTIFILLLTVFAVGFAGCNKDKQNEPPYDVAIKIANNFGLEWIFEPGVDELYYEFEYTGEDMTFGVDEYYVYGEPRFGDRWLDCSGSAINDFVGSWGYKNLEGKTENVNSVLEKGEYCYTIYTHNSSWNYRSIRLYITVK